MDALDVALQDYSKEEKQKIVQLIKQSGINPRDPLFMVMASLGKFEFLMDQLPPRLNSLVETWTVAIDNKLQQASSVALVQQNKAIAEAAEKLVSQVSTSVSSDPKVLSSTYLGNIKLYCASLILGAVLALGAMIGGVIYAVAASNYSSPEGLSLQDKNLLLWAKSDAGRQALEIQKINANTIEVCKKQRQQLKGKCVISVFRE